MAKKAVKLPKKIGGVKLSKSVRKPAEKLIAKAQTAEGRQAIAAGLAMAASAVASQRAARVRPAAAPVPPVPPIPPVPPVPPRAPSPRSADANGPSGDADTPAVNPQEIVDAVGRAVNAFVDGFLSRRR